MNRDDWERFDRAWAFARGRHANQLRRDGKTPYSDHLLRVAWMVRDAGAPLDVVCAALLHDSIEDTATSYDDIADAFGAPVADLVVHLTEDKRERRDVRKQRVLAELESLPRWAKVIKLADLLDNLYCLESSAQTPSRLRKQLDHSALWADRLADAEPELARRARAEVERLRSALADG